MKNSGSLNQPIWVVAAAILLAALLAGLLLVPGDRRQTMPEPNSSRPVPASSNTNVSQDITSWINQHAIPFKTSKPGSSFEDLMPLKQIIGDARIVALGEATHGTHEFFEMKHRLVEFLVQEMGFNVFAIEATWPESNLVNDYVHTGNGDPAKLLAGLYFWTWNTQEVLDMIQWMRTHNQHPGNEPTVSFLGFDMQSPRMAMNNVIAYVQKVDAPQAQEFTSLYTCFRRYQNNSAGYASAQAAIKSQCHKQAQQAYDDLNSHRPAYEAASSSGEFALALQSARLVLQAEAAFSSSMSEYAAVRDRSMAENITWLLNQAGPQAKIILWAHNAHVSANSPSYKNMGSYLREQYGKEMIVFGFDFYKGSFNAVSQGEPGLFGELTSHQTPPPPTGSYEDYFHRSGLPRMFLDLRGIQVSSVTEWINGPRPVRSIGAVYNDAHPDNFFYQARLPEEFDVLIYFEETSPSLLLPSATRQKASKIDWSAYLKQPANLDFEVGQSGWFVDGIQPEDYAIGTDHTVKHNGNTSGYITTKTDAPLSFGTLKQRIQADVYRGKRLRMSGYVKTEAVEEWAGLFLRIDGVNGDVLSVDDMQNRPIQGTSDWRKYEIVFDVPESSINIAFGILLQGKGKVWIDDLKFEVVGQDVPTTNSFRK
ncbi:erythromycin esterase family protein [Candidatus Acetothermia bacterium]|nr:erythromycin esterase family protein [Candidatus Acetothermia bacterium]